MNIRRQIAMGSKRVMRGAEYNPVAIELQVSPDLESWLEFASACFADDCEWRSIDTRSHDAVVNYINEAIDCEMNRACSEDAESAVAYVKFAVAKNRKGAGANMAAAKENEQASKKINLNVEYGLASWVEFAAALKGVSQTAYINHAIRQDMEHASTAAKEAYQAFLKAKGQAED